MRRSSAIQSLTAIIDFLSRGLQQDSTQSGSSVRQTLGQLISGCRRSGRALGAVRNQPSGLLKQFEDLQYQHMRIPGLRLGCFYLVANLHPTFV